MENTIRILSERLLLRPIRMKDADSVFTYRSNVVVNKYQGWIPKTTYDVHDFITNRVSPKINQSGTWFQFVIIKNDNNELIGDIGIHFLASDARTNNFQSPNRLNFHRIDQMLIFFFL